MKNRKNRKKRQKDRLSIVINPSRYKNTTWVVTALNIFANLSGIATKMADLEMENKLIDEFGEFGIDIDGNLGVLGKCKNFYFHKKF